MVWEGTAAFWREYVVAVNNEGAISWDNVSDNLKGAMSERFAAAEAREHKMR